MAGTNWKYTDELRERTLILASYGVPGAEIAKIIGCEAKSTVNNMIRVAKLVESDQLEEAKAISITACKSLAGFEWACKKYGKKLPEPEPKHEEPKEIPVINNRPTYIYVSTIGDIIVIVKSSNFGLMRMIIVQKEYLKERLTMYEELIERLRTEECLPYTTLKTMREAADAIEAMREYVDTMRRLKCEGYQLQQIKFRDGYQAMSIMPIPEPPKEEI